MRELLTIVKSLLRMTFLIKAVVLVMPNWHTESLEYPLDYNHIQTIQTINIFKRTGN